MEELVTLARRTIEEFFRSGKLKIESYEKFKDKKGVFVTINSYPKHELRGCVGFIQSEHPLSEAVQRAALEAAFHDSRFPPLEREELNKIIFEVSVLSIPRIINGGSFDRLKKIKEGVDGLILERGFSKALLLPQVWEEIPDKKEFFKVLCWKCGLPSDAWSDKNSKLYKFNVESVKEVEPKGKTVKIDFKSRGR